MTDRPPPAYQRVADDLYQRILGGRLSAGDRLPSEAELAEEFSVSRSTIREALRSLASRKFIVTTRGVSGGSFIVPQSDVLSDQLAESLDRLMVTDDISLSELLEAREILEVPAAGLAALRRTPAQLAELEASVPAAGSDAESGEPRHFHALMVRASGNRLLESVTTPLFGVIRNRFQLHRMPVSFWSSVFEEHQRILDAIRSSDHIHAEYEMQQHLSHLRDTYRLLWRSEVSSSSSSAGDSHRDWKDTE